MRSDRLLCKSTAEKPGGRRSGRDISLDAVIEAVLSELNAFKRNKKTLEAFLPGDLSLTLSLFTTAVLSTSPQAGGG